jgi:hypothetical protein
MTFAGAPATITFEGTFLVTTLPAATMDPLPIVTPGRMVEFAPIQPSSPINTPSLSVLDGCSVIGKSGTKEWFEPIIETP